MEVRCTSSKNRRVVRLPDDLVLEILARVPYRSLCQFKCVSGSWRALCSDPAVLRRCPQTLTGFFFRTLPLGRSRHVRHFVNASGRGPPMVDPSLSFLPGYSDSGFLDCCNGLLLCRCNNIHPKVVYTYFVCNPATEKWIDLPDLEMTERRYSFRAFRLCFDPAVSSHFRVFVLWSDPRPQAPQQAWDQVTGVDIFSSETGAWSYRQSEWGDGHGAVIGWHSVFFNGTLHLTSPGSSSLLTVDMDGRAWGRIPTPHDFRFIGVSQGRLHAVHRRNNGRDDGESISIWVLEDYAGQRWTLKHAVTAVQMFRARPRSFRDSYSFIVHAVHPQQCLIFLTAGKPRSLMSYDMDKKKVRFIRNLRESDMSAHLYVPCFSDWLSDGN